MEIFNFPNYTRFKIINEVSGDKYKEVVYIENGILKFETTPEKVGAHNFSNQVPITKETVSYKYIMLND